MRVEIEGKSIKVPGVQFRNERPGRDSWPIVAANGQGLFAVRFPPGKLWSGRFMGPSYIPAEIKVFKITKATRRNVQVEEVLSIPLGRVRNEKAD